MAILDALTDLHEPFGPARPDSPRRLVRTGAALIAPVAALLVPDRGVPRMVIAGRFRLAMVIVVAAAALAAGAVVARLDVAPTVRAEHAGQVAQAGSGNAAASEPIEDTTDGEIEEEIEKRAAMIQVKVGLAALLGTPARILLLGLALFLLGRYVGGQPSFERALAAGAVGALPWAVRSLIAAAATWRQEMVGPSDLDNLVAGALPVSVDHPLLASLVAGADLFTLWSVILCSFGLAAAAGIGRIRSTIAVVVGFLLLLMVSSAGAR